MIINSALFLCTSKNKQMLEIVMKVTIMIKVS